MEGHKLPWGLGSVNSTRARRTGHAGAARWRCYWPCVTLLINCCHMRRRTALLLGLATLIILIAAWLSKPRKAVTEVPTEAEEVAATEPTRAPGLVRDQPAVQNTIPPLSPAQEELKRLESEFYNQYPLALHYRELQKDEGPTPEIVAVGERFKSWIGEVDDVRTKNLRSGNLNIIMELESPLMLKEMLVSGSDLGQMIRVSFKARQWDWPHSLRNVDSRIDFHAPERPAADTPEQLILALQAREPRIIEYCQRKQEEAAIPEFIREDIREFNRDRLTRAVVRAYMETITPPQVTEARKSAALEANPTSQP
jgi:hypothetical protein